MTRITGVRIEKSNTTDINGKPQIHASIYNGVIVTATVRNYYKKFRVAYSDPDNRQFRHFDTYEAAEAFAVEAPR